MFYSLHIENLTTGQLAVLYIKGAKLARAKAQELKAQARSVGDRVLIIRRNYRGEGCLL